MESNTGDRRHSRRFNVRLTLRYRVSERGSEQRWNTAITRDMSRDGVIFKTRRTLPVGAHLEMRFDWPVRYDSTYPVALQATGFVMRSAEGRTAVRISSHRFDVNFDSASLRATA